VKRAWYREQDSAFGQLMLTLRTNIGLTQVGLAKLLGISRHAVAAWEAGRSYPTAEHLKTFIALGVKLQAFASGRRAEEIRALWHAAHQKVLLDEAWLQGLLSQQPSPRVEVAVEPTRGAAVLSTPPFTSDKGGIDETSRNEAWDASSRGFQVPQAFSGPRVDWGDALDVPSFYGREEELATLEQWIVQERCRVVSVLGLGGIGKSALAVRVMHRVAAHFEVVLWRSLRDAPGCEALLDECLQVLAPQPLPDLPDSLEGRLHLLMEQLRARRALLVLDNLEMLLEEGEGMGHMRAGYEGYGRLLRRVAQTEHQSCLLLTSREKPTDLVSLEGSRTPVRALRLSGLEREAGEQLLEEREMVGTASGREQLIERYGGNPLALKIVSQTIVELFGGEIALFLEQGEVVFGGVRELLGEQFDRLSVVEQTVMLWMAILREPVSIEELLSVLGTPLSRGQVLEAIEALRRRSLIERGKRRGSFTLQSVVLEYATAQLIAEAASEIEQGRLARLIEHGLTLATAREYVWQTQKRLIVAPLLGHLHSMYRGRDEVEERLLGLLDQLRARADYAQGYGPANLLALLREHRGHLRGLDLSQLVIRGASLQGVEMQDTTLAGVTVRDSTFTEAFAANRAVAISNDGTYWAAGGMRGEVRVWRQEGKLLHLAWQAHTDAVAALAFSPDGRTLATGSWDGFIKLWELERGALLWTSRHTDIIHCVAFSPDGHTLASGGDSATVRLWDASSGTHLQTLTGDSGPVYSVAWSPDGSLLANGSFDGIIRLWEMQGAQQGAGVRMLAGHTNWVYALAFAPDGRTLASGGWDRTVKLWDMASGRCLQTLSGHTRRVGTVVWSPDGRLLASCGRDETIWLWDIELGSYRTALHGHTADVRGLAFTPDSRSLLSGSTDGTLRVWDVESGQCVHIMQGYAVSLYDVAWSPAGPSSSPSSLSPLLPLPANNRQGGGSQLASAGTDRLVTIWAVADRTPLRVLRGHSWSIYGVTWSPDGRLLASSGWDSTVRLWDVSTGTCVQLLRDPDYIDTVFYGVAWSPDGQWLATGSYQQGVQVWEVTTGICRWVGRGLPTRVRRVEWSPDGTLLASCCDDGSVFLWEASHGRLRASLQGHRGMVMSVAWSPDGTWLASGGGGSDSEELFVWDVQSGERLHALSELGAVVYALAWSPTGVVLLSGGSDGMLRWWDLQHRECVRVRKAHQGAVQSLKSSPDGQRLASCGDDGVINVWDLQSGDLLQTLRRDRPYERLDITGIRGLTQAQKATLRALGAIEDAAFKQGGNPRT
jgi:WD40 repeat protein/transcriptional regulator with XRE-family HTH domain